MRALTAIITILSIMNVCVANETNVDSCLVHVIVTYQQHDPFQPWQKARPSMRYGYGIIVDDSRIITTEHLVRNHTLVELCKARSGEKITATVEMSDHQVNLALLKANNLEIFTETKPVEVARNVPCNADVEVLQFDENKELQRGDAKVIQVTMAMLPSAPSPSLIFKLSTDLNINREGAPVIYQNKLAGITMNYEQNTRIANMLPYPAITKFLEDTPYHGVASAGFQWTDLVDPAKRSYLNVQRPGGILILSSLPGTGASETLKTGDVILQWDGYTIDNLGFYDDPVFGRLSFPYLITGRRKPGDTSSVLIVRDGTEMTVDVDLQQRLDKELLVPENVTGEKPEYLVEGGLVLRELSGEYLRAHGSNWRRLVGSRLSTIYETRQFDVEQEGDRIVILSGILPHPVNIGYQHFRNIPVTSVNGESIRNMKDVFKIVEKDGYVKSVKLHSIGMELVLDENSLEKANLKIAQLYHIPNLRNQSLLDD